ncbi:MAG: zinc finger Ran-binding domain-containing protein [Eubacterium sp.]|nr:zinc finger Ran-binding domain-containing protein [Eubacterium sp.]
MKRRAIVSIILSLVMGVVSIPVIPVRTDVACAATPKLSASKITVRVGSKKTLKVKNTSYAAYFYISSGSSRIKLTNRKAKQVKIKGVKPGKATVKAKVWLTSKKTKTLTCKVTVKDKKWTCPSCGKVNDTNYCSNCGQPKPDKATPTPTASAEPTESPTPSPTPTSAPPDALSETFIVMSLNNTYYFALQMYKHATATDFYNRVISGKISTVIMAPLEDVEKFAFFSDEFKEYVSGSKTVEKGEVFLYGTNTLKLSLTDHEAGAYPTRIGKIVDPSDLDRAVRADSEGRTRVVFRKDM